MEEIIKYNEKTNELEVASELVNQIINFESVKVEMDLKEKQLKEDLLKAMKKYNVSSWKSNDGKIKAVYKPAYLRSSIDSKKLKEELPDIAEEFSKEIMVSESVSLSVEV